MGATPSGMPWPDASEGIRLGDEAIEALANRYYDIQTGVATLTFTAVAVATVTVTFPRVFVRVPIVGVTFRGTALDMFPFLNVPPTTSTMQVGARHTENTVVTRSVPVTWIAIDVGGQV